MTAQYGAPSGDRARSGGRLGRVAFARTPADRTHPVPTVSFRAMGLSFRYPVMWPPAPGDEFSSFTDLIVYLRTPTQLCDTSEGAMSPTALPAMYLLYARRRMPTRPPIT